MPKKQVFSGYPLKGKTNKKLTFEDRFEGVNSTPLITEYKQRIQRRMQQLNKVLFRFYIYRGEVNPTPTMIMKNYIKYYHEFYEYDQFDDGFKLLPSLDVNLSTVTDDAILYKSYNLFKGCQWNVRLGNKFSARLQDFALNQLEYILSFVMLIAEGHFHGRNSKNISGSYGFITPIETKTIPHNRFFSLKIFREKNVIFNVGVEKIPVVKNGVIKRYEFYNYVQFLDIITDQIGENPKKLADHLQRFQKVIEEDVAKKDHSDDLTIQIGKGTKINEANHLFVEVYNPYTHEKEVFTRDLERDYSYQVKPYNFKPVYVSSSETSTLIFDKSMKRWISSEYLSRMEKKALNEYQRKVNEEMIKRFVDFQSAKTLVELLTKIPNFRVKLTEEEKNVIGENGNVLVIGRSGTGKTTCAVLRLFAIQMLFKIRLSLSKKKYQASLKDTRCSADDINETMGLHCVFLTASPVLTNEIQRYYKKLTDNIKAELEKKKKRVEEEKKLSMKKQNRPAEEATVAESEVKKQQQPEMEEEMIEKEQSLAVPQQLTEKKSQEVIQEEQEMQEELGGIQIQQKLENQEFIEEEEDFDNMKEQIEDKMKKFKSLEDLGEEDYPGFFTVKSFIMMIDATLKKPFFIRRKNDEGDEENKATWHNERRGVMMIENYFKSEQEQKKQDQIEEEIEEQINYSDQEELQHQYLRQIQLRQNKQKQKLTEKLTKNKRNNLSFEVDYDYFLTHFWPTVRHRYYSARVITPHLVWTEIFSTIKGGASAHMYPGQYYSQNAYIKESSNVFLTKQEKLDVFQTFCQYERWKINSGGYDLMDAVNYILNYMRFRGYDGPELHYIMIDQVQDLPHAIVYLLSKTVTYGVFYSGDTAQTIAKGIGFRFCDLKNLFDPRQFDYSLTLKKPIVKQLTVNFRSHNNILQLANSIVSSLELLFPKTIDRLKKEVSNITGPRPIILSDEDEQLLFYVLCGDEMYKKAEGEIQGAAKRPPLEFGCDQVIIVRDQESKSKVPPMLQHALCLTIYEAKGLEFNDVILFNFFSETKCPEKWNLLKFLKVIIDEVDKDQYEKNITKHEDYEENKNKEEIGEKSEISAECMVNKADDKYFVKKIVTDAKLVLKDINDYAQLCSELKMLYTAITRPRKTLIIYDENSGARKSLEKLWDRLEVVEVINKELINEGNKKKKEQSEEVKIFKKIVNSTNNTEWKKQGLKMYARGYFEQAMKCFDRSGHNDLYKKSYANYLADNATKRLIQIESQRNAIKNKLFKYSKMHETDISKLKKKLKKDEHQVYQQFLKGGLLFEDLLMFKQAGQCYFSGKKYHEAFSCFSKAFMNKQAAESLEMMNKYRQAAEYYEKDGNFLKIIECLDMINEWEAILKTVHKYEVEMTPIQKQSLLRKYSALALQELVYEIQFENEVDEEKPENNRVEIIKEETESQQESDSWDYDEDPELAAERSLRKKSSADLSEQMRSPKITAKESEPKRKLSQPEQVIQSIYQKPHEQGEEKQEIKDKSKVSQDESSFADLNESSEIIEKQQSEEKKQIKSVENSFADLNSEESSFADLNSISEDINARYPAELDPDIESIRSMADPEDPWVKSALSEIKPKTHSEYSIIDQDENYNPNVRIIKTKGNIFIQDEIMRKIVNIVSIVNASVNEFFKQFKGYQSLITISQTEQKQTIDNRPEISEFEDVDPQFINIILDTLESFKLYKLCLFVCNRYHMPHKAGRYLVSMALKYGTNSQINNTLNPALLSPSMSRKQELEKGILASIALHAIFENVSSDFLKIKVSNKGEKKNTLGSYFIEGIILEGLYKKAVFIVNPQESLVLLKNFFDFPIYKQVFKQKALKITDTESKYSFLEYKPKTELENQFTIQALEQMLYQFNIIHKHELLPHRLFRESHPMDIKLIFAPEKVPEYAPTLRALLNISQEEKTQGQFLKVMEERMLSGYQILLKRNNFEVYDIAASLTTIVTHQEFYPLVFRLSHDAFLELYRCLELMRISILKQHTPNSFILLQSILSLFQARLIKNCQSTKFINDGYAFIKRHSTLANDYVEQMKKNPNETGFFFEQDYNLIIVRAEKLLKIVSSKFNLAFSKFLRRRSKWREGERFNYCYLPADFKALQTEELMRGIFKFKEGEILGKKKQKEKKRSVKVRKEKPKFDYKMHGKQELAISLYSDDESDVDQVTKQAQVKKNNGFVFSDLNPKLKYCYHQVLGFFDSQPLNRKCATAGKILYCSGMNDMYKEYVDKLGGYNLFDAIEFRKFKRLDLYTDNILSIIDDLSFYDRHMIMVELLVLLLINYKSVTQGKKFKIELSRNLLKYLPGLQLMEILGDKKDLNSVLNENFEICVFAYKFEYASEMRAEEIVQAMCELLQIIKAEDSSKYVNFPDLVLNYLINMTPESQIFSVLKSIIDNSGGEWMNPLFQPFRKVKDFEDFCQTREKVLSDQVLVRNSITLHEIRIEDCSNLNKAIEESQFDYEVKVKIQNARKNAANKIGQWWKVMKKKQKRQKQNNTIWQNRMVKLYHPNVQELPIDDEFLIDSSQLRSSLLNFYLKNVVSSSLDFHFILMTLNRIEDLRNIYISAFDEEKFRELDEDPNLVHEQIDDLKKNVEVWKSDSKWLKDRNLDLKKKKVFQVKWLTKTSIQSKIAKKRAGLKKQRNLQLKKQLLKKH